MIENVVGMVSVVQMVIVIARMIGGEKPAKVQSHPAGIVPTVNMVIEMVVSVNAICQTLIVMTIINGRLTTVQTGKYALMGLAHVDRKSGVRDTEHAIIRGIATVTMDTMATTVRKKYPPIGPVMSGPMTRTAFVIVTVVPMTLIAICPTLGIQSIHPSVRPMSFAMLQVIVNAMAPDDVMEKAPVAKMAVVPVTMTSGGSSAKKTFQLNGHPVPMLSMARMISVNVTVVPTILIVTKRITSHRPISRVTFIVWMVMGIATELFNAPVMDHAQLMVLAIANMAILEPIVKAKYQSTGSVIPIGMTEMAFVSVIVGPLIQIVVLINLVRRAVHPMRNV